MVVPASLPFELAPGAPTATKVPSALTDTFSPNKSPAAFPSISIPFFTHATPLHSYTLNWPEEFPFPSLAEAPIVKISPLLLIETEIPEASPAASPSISKPLCTHADPFHK